MTMVRPGKTRYGATLEDGRVFHAALSECGEAVCYELPATDGITITRIALSHEALLAMVQLSDAVVPNDAPEPEDGEVVGIDTDGSAICWNAETKGLYNSGEPPTDAERAALTPGVSEAPALAGLAEYLRRAANGVITNCDRSGVGPREQQVVEKLRGWASEVDRIAGVQAAQPAHSKSEYKRRVAQGDPNVAPPAGVPASPLPEQVPQDPRIAKALADNAWDLYARADGVPAVEKPMSETGWPYNEKVQCAKRIMEAVDTYQARPDGMNRTALRGVILTELEEYATVVKEVSDAG